MAPRARDQGQAARGATPNRTVAQGQRAQPCASVNPLLGRRARPTRSEARTEVVPAARATVVRTDALAARTVIRFGTAVSVVRIIPVPYSAPTAGTARTATTACPTVTPVIATTPGVAYRITDTAEDPC
ncbi:hypothetical protein AB0G86_40550 [Streptomyces scabiei]|uniref:hypothetical protein n=1 Tax=Streptomyces scabiei TaxID=1930 RepID=UPI0033FAA81B